ncbi:MAG: type II secretion system protein [Bacilli bacterium]|nr:type II secretion system protein [Bacilli bacterium]
MNRKGFTLIELLAVIVILALIALISVPMILGIVEKVKKGALGATANGLLESATLYYAKNLNDIGENKAFLFDETHDGETSDNIKLTYKGDFKGTGSVRIYKDGKTAICIQNEKYYAIKNINNTKVTTGTGTCSYDEATNTYLSVNLVSQELVDDLQAQVDDLTDEINNLKSLGNATASDIMSGKTAVVNGELITGTIPNLDGNSGFLGNFYYYGGITLNSSVQMPVIDYDSNLVTKSGESIIMKKNVLVKCLIGQGGEGNRAYLSIRVYKNGVVVATYNCVDNLYSTATAPGYFTFEAVQGDVIDVKFVSSPGDGALGEPNKCQAILWY